jgi:pyridoxal 5'-phosphate synthase pdxT subunit
VIGVLGLQGDFAAHGRVLTGLGADWRIVKKPDQLGGLAGLIVPGGESTTLIKLMDSFSFWEPLRAFAASGGGVLGTCAGMIIAARQVRNPPQRSLGLIDITVERNSYGRQIDSFEARGQFHAPAGQSRPLEMVFIRAPRIVRLGPQVEQLASCRGDCVLARQERVMVASFHPELTADATVHQLFLQMCRNDR